MALKTTLEQLEEVQAAITAVMANQSYTIDGRTFTRARLDDLMSWEERLTNRYNQEVLKNKPRVAKATFRG